MLDFLRKFLPKTDRPTLSAAGARGGFNYSGGPLFGPWDPSVHAAPGQYARFGRAAARPLSVFSTGGERTKVLDCDTKAGAVKVQGRLDRVYTVSLIAVPARISRSAACRASTYTLWRLFSDTLRRTIGPPGWTWPAPMASYPAPPPVTQTGFFATMCAA